jgi:hypothetical protein
MSIISDLFGESGSELKSDQKDQFQPPLWAEGSGDCSKPIPGGTTSENPPAPAAPPLQRKPWLKYPGLIPTKAVVWQHPLPHSPAYQP